MLAPDSLGLTQKEYKLPFFTWKRKRTGLSVTVDKSDASDQRRACKVLSADMGLHDSRVNGAMALPSRSKTSARSSPPLVSALMKRYLPLNLIGRVVNT